MPMKKSFILILSAMMVLLVACGSEAGEGEKKKVKIGISQIVEHPSLDATREGIIKALKDEGYVEGKNLEVDVQIAQGDMGNNTTIAQKFASGNYDVIVGIATPSAQAIAQATAKTDIPVVFSVVTDPLGAKLVKDLKKPEKNITGVSDSHPEAVEKTIESVKEFFPEAKSVGILYNAGEQNSVSEVKKAEKIIKDNGLKVVKTTVANTSEVKQAAESMVGRADVIFLPRDNTVISALPSVVKVANDQDIPLFTSDADSVKGGAFAAYGFEYADLGYTTGNMVLEILNGKKPNELPVRFPEKLELVINEKAAEEQGIKLTDEMKKQAIIIEE